MAHPYKPTKRVGRLSISLELIESGDNLAQLLFSNIVPLSVQARYDCMAYDIIAISEAFDLVDFGAIIPEYKAIMTVGEFENTVEFERLPKDYQGVAFEEVKR